jgi:hypothetical protein
MNTDSFNAKTPIQSASICVHLWLKLGRQDFPLAGVAGFGHKSAHEPLEIATANLCFGVV